MHAPMRDLRGHGRRFVCPGAARGFTLIEVLVALAIVAIALLASLRAVSSLADSEADLQRRLFASWSADNVLARLRLAHAWPDIGERQFDCSQGNLRLVCTERVSTTPNPLFRRVDVSVTMPGRTGSLAQLVTVLGDETNRPL